MVCPVYSCVELAQFALGGHAKPTKFTKPYLLVYLARVTKKHTHKKHNYIVPVYGSQK